MTPENELLQQALDHHIAGNLEEAGRMYREILSADPDNGDANNLLGALYCHEGQCDRAIVLIRKAVDAFPDRYAYHLNLGVAYENYARLEEAEECYRKALALSPRGTDALFNLANCYQKMNEIGKAIDLYREVAGLSPDNPNVFLNLGNCHFMREEYGDAEEAYQKAHSLDPGNGDILFSLAMCRREQGDLVEAEKLFGQVLEARPDHEAALLELGNSYFARKRFLEASRYFQTVVDLYPDNLAAVVNKANCLQKQGSPAEAEKFYLEVIERDPENVPAYYNLGQCYLKQGRLKEAEDTLRTAAKIDLANENVREMLARVLAVLGSALLAQGKRSEALATYRESLELDADSFETLLDMSEIFEKSNRLDDSWEYVKKLLETAPDHPEVNRIAAVIMRRRGEAEAALDRLGGVEIPDDDHGVAAKIHYELGILKDFSGEYDQAFMHFQKANRFREPWLILKDADKERFLHLLQRINNTFTTGYTGSMSHESFSADDDTPIFLVGFPRSGTTLMDQILDSHSRLQVMEEQPVLSGAIEEINRNFSGPLEYPEAVFSLEDAHIRGIRESYLHAVDRFIVREEGSVLVDKMPLNIIHTGLIHRLFPGAKIILAVRHPYDVCLSNFMQDYQLNDAMANFMTLEDAAVLYDRVMSLWQQYERNLQLDFHMIRYEDLVEEPEEQQRKLFGFLGLELEEDCLNFHEHARAKEWIRTPSYQQVTEPIYTDAKYRWKSYAAYFAPHEELLSKYIEYFGY
jgi:tetratricopeptide (TPR) repeat protein